MPTPSLLERIKHARIFQVFIVYLGASWVILQIAEVLAEALSLPDWVLPVCVLLLLVGLLIILATAWVQSLASTTAKEEAGEIPTDWQIAPADAIASLTSGQLPHLTWGRAILGGVVMLSLLFGGTGLYVGFRGTTMALGPEEAGADEAATGIAVVPFTITGDEELDLWSEGMVDLLSTHLDGMGGFRTIASRTVMARWRERVSEDESADLRTALEAAAQTGARYGLVGTLVGNPAGLRMSAEVYDLSTGEKVAQAAQEGTTEQVLDMASSLSVALTRELLRGSGQSTVQDVRLEGLTTTSLPALREYLEGEAAFRDGDFGAAAAAYERAVAQDSLFALAWFRLSDAYGWLEDIGSETGRLASDRASGLLDRLPARERLIVQASRATLDGDATFFETLRSGVLRYPDDPDLWYELGDYIYHVGIPAGLATREQAVDAFERAIALDPGFVTYQVHPIEFAIASGDRAAAEAQLARYQTAAVDQRRIREFSLAIPLLLGDSTEAARAIETSRESEFATLSRVRLGFTNKQDRYDRLRELLWTNRGRAGSDDQWILYSLGAEGALNRADRLLDSLDIALDTKGVAVGWMMGNWTTARDLPHRTLARPTTCEEPVVSIACHGFVGWGAARGGDLTTARESLRLLEEYESTYAPTVAGAIAIAEGRITQARTLLRPAAGGGNSNPAYLARQSLGELEFLEGNVAEAIRYHSGNLGTYGRSFAALALARIYDARGQADLAVEFYKSFRTITAAGDQDLPEIVEAREALARLGN